MYLLQAGGKRENIKPTPTTSDSCILDEQFLQGLVFHHVGWCVLSEEGVAFHWPQVLFQTELHKLRILPSKELVMTLLDKHVEASKK